jgi:hypothetical protein
MTILKRLILAIAITLAVPGLTGASGPTPGVLDSKADFSLLATRGFDLVVNGSTALVDGAGTLRNSYAWSGEWFGGSAFVGTVVREGTVQQLRGEIWRYTPGVGAGVIAGSWTRVFQSPTGFFIPQEIGYRWMTVCDPGDTGTPKLFVSTLGLQTGRILYSTDGNTFQQVTTTGLPTNAPGYRTIVCFKPVSGPTLLITSPVGEGSLQSLNPDARNESIVLATANISGSWTPYSALRMGNSDNNSFFAIEVLKRASLPDVLYVGVSNIMTGAEIWRTPLAGGCALSCSSSNIQNQWTKIVDNGAGRSFQAGIPQNVGVSDMVQHKDMMYAALSVSAGDRITAELIRIQPPDDATNPDGFEVIIGEPRFNFDTTPILNFLCATPENIDGVGVTNDCAPVSKMGAGVGKIGPTVAIPLPGAVPGGDPYPDGNAFYIWRGLSSTYPALGAPSLYIGTLEGFSTGGGGGGTPGFDLLVSTDDGATWKFITTTGFDVEGQSGLRTIFDSPIGIFVGGANFPPGSATDPGGCAVWLGTCDPALAQPPVSDPRAKLKSAPGQVVFLQNLQRFVAYDDEAAPNGKVSVTLEGSSSTDPFCGDIVEYRWDKGDLTAACGVATPGAMGIETPPGGDGNLAPITLCSSSDPEGVVDGCPDAAFADALIESNANYADYRFTLQVKDDVGNLTCKTVIVRASANLPPAVTVVTDPPAVLSQGSLSVNLVDFDANGSQTLTLRGMCIDPESALSSCTWSADAGVTFGGLALPGADADPATLGTSYTATVPVGAGFGQRNNIDLTGIDALSNLTRGRITVRVRTTADDTTENDNPVCQGTSRTTPKNTALTITPASPLLCADPEGNPIAYTVVTPPAALTGSVTGGGNLIYTPPGDFIGEALFSFKACETSTPELECSDVVGVRVTVQDVAPPPPPPSGGTPLAPTGLNTHKTGGGLLEVTWTDVATNETNYDVQRCRIRFACRYSTVATLGAGATMHTEGAALVAGATYRYRVRARNAAGSSAWVVSTPDVVQ